jgi:hypothetical protein
MYSNECIVMNVHTLMRDGSDGCGDVKTSEASEAKQESTV